MTDDNTQKIPELFTDFSPVIWKAPFCDGSHSSL